MLATLDALCIVNQWTGQIEDYDFSKDTGEYYLFHAYSDKTYAKGAAISEKRREVADSFMNRSQKQIQGAEGPQRADPAGAGRPDRTDEGIYFPAGAGAGGAVRGDAVGPDRVPGNDGC